MSLTVADLLAAPVGVALLDGMEKAQREGFPPNALEDSKPEAVNRARDRVESMTVGELLRTALHAANHIAGPWNPSAASSLAFAYQLASERLSIAEGICERFGARLEEGIDLSAQECWLSYIPGGDYWEEAAFRDFTDVYGNGEFTWDGFWTVTTPPPETNDELVEAWEMFDRPITRWLLPVDEGVRLWPIDRPSDWVDLVESYPLVGSVCHHRWELPGPNQDQKDTESLSAVESQHALRRQISRYVLPDWTAVARDFDGVHLSWAGFLTTEGFVSDLPSGGVTMLRYWSSERSLWLRDVFGEPGPLDAPELSGQSLGAIGQEAISGDENRRFQDLVLMSRRLGR